jgi:hypothetical protein
VTFNFQKYKEKCFLCINFDEYEDPEVISEIANGEPVEEVKMLWRFANLPCAKIYSSIVRLPDGRRVELVDTVEFEIREVSDGVWETKGNESEVDQHNRLMMLNGLRDQYPGILSETASDMSVASQADSGVEEVVFTRGEVIFTDSPPVPCDGCKEHFFMNEVDEIKPGLLLCKICQTKLRRWV